MKIVKWDPFKDIIMADDFFDPLSKIDPRENRCTWSPAVDVYETEKDLVLTAELPGVQEEDMSLTLLENVVSLKGERKFERDVKQENYFRIERNYGYFCRRFTLPCEVEADKITASFDEGVLKVVIPKSARSKKVHVRVGK